MIYGFYRAYKLPVQSKSNLPSEITFDFEMSNVHIILVEIVYILQMIVAVKSPDPKQSKKWEKTKGRRQHGNESYRRMNKSRGPCSNFYLLFQQKFNSRWDISNITDIGGL
jgi:hypothetical protein